MFSPRVRISASRPLAFMRSRIRATRPSNSAAGNDSSLNGRPLSIWSALLAGLAVVAAIGRQEHLFDRHRRPNDALIGEIFHRRLERRPVWLDAVGPGIALEHLIELVDVGRHPRSEERRVGKECRYRV